MSSYSCCSLCFSCLTIPVQSKFSFGHPMDCLREMGYTEAQAKGALQKSGGNVESAIMFLLDNPDYVGVM